MLVLSPPWRTVLVLVIERFACMASTRLLLRLTNRRSLTRGSRSLSPFAYPLPNSCPIQRVDQDGMIQLLDRSSTSTSTASLSTSTVSGKSTSASIYFSCISWSPRRAPSPPKNLRALRAFVLNPARSNYQSAGQDASEAEVDEDLPNEPL